MILRSYILVAFIIIFIVFMFPKSTIHNETGGPATPESETGSSVPLIYSAEL